MQEKRSMRFGKWLLKAIVSYAVFIAAGLLLSFVPARRLGLSEEMFLNLRMFFMLFGPIYLTLFVKIILTFIAAAKRREPDVSREARESCSLSPPCCCLPICPTHKRFPTLRPELSKAKGCGTWKEANSIP